MSARVTLVDRGRVRADMGYVLSGYTTGGAAEPNPDHEIGNFVVWAAVIETDSQTVLVDTGPPTNAESYWPDPLYDAFEAYDAADRSLQSDLDAVGYAIDDIDAVVMTHLHLDHAGELSVFEGTDVPVYVHEDELPFAFTSAHTTEGSIAYLAADFDGGYNWQLVHGETHTLDPAVRLRHLPGHTPGLMGLQVTLPDEETLLIAGDEAYVEANYTDGVPLGPGLLWDSCAWRRSRERLRELERQTDAMVLYGHDLAVFQSIDAELSS